MTNPFSRPDLMAGYAQTLKQQEKTVTESIGQVSDFVHRYDQKYTQNGNIFFADKRYP